MNNIENNIEDTAMNPKVVGGHLHVDGHVYVRSRTAAGKMYWDCHKVRRRECRARAISTIPTSTGVVTLYKGPNESKHAHAPNVEAAKAEELTQTIKDTAASHPELVPSQILRSHLAGVSSGILSQLPEQSALTRTIQRVRRKELPANPRKLKHLGDLPVRFTRTLSDELFLLYDTGPADEEDSDDEDSEIESEEDDDSSSRVIVFATRRNLEILCKSPIWFVDGTFDVAPTIFAQLFTVLGLVQRRNPVGESVALPLLYALLPGKTQDMYEEVMTAVRDGVQRYRINACAPLKIISDFELGIIRACQKVYPGVPVTACFFHLCQSIYRHVQEEGLATRYRDPDDRSIRDFAHMTAALAFVPISDVRTVFQLLRDECPDEYLPVLQYFGDTYVLRRQRTRRGHWTEPRYPPNLWNQYDAALNRSHKTNNISEGWHSRFNLVVGKHHPDLYSAVIEFQKEQAFTESNIAELALGKRVKLLPRRKWLELQERIQGIVASYEDQKADGTLMEYMRALADNITM